jgi:hypothetical protein
MTDAFVTNLADIDRIAEYRVQGSPVKRTTSGLHSLIPIYQLQERISVWRERTGKTIHLALGDLTDYSFTESLIADFRPDAIVHYGEQRSAPFSMIDQASHQVRPRPGAGELAPSSQPCRLWLYLSRPARAADASYSSTLL